MPSMLGHQQVQQRQGVRRARCRGGPRARRGATARSSTTSTSMPQAPSCSPQDQPVGLVVVDDQDPHVGEPVGRPGLARCRRRRRAGSGSVNQNVLPSPGSLSTPSVPPMAVTNWREMARPRPVPPNLRVVEESACENGVEEALGVRHVDADAGVGDLEPDHHAVGAGVLQLGAEHDLALLGELHRVRGQVQQHLAQSGRVAAQPDAAAPGSSRRAARGPCAAPTRRPARRRPRRPGAG